MTAKRTAGTIAAAFVVSQILAVVIHGFILGPDYAPLYGTLLRPQETAGAQMLLLPVAHLVFVSGLTWLYTRLPLGGSMPMRGVTLGVIGYLVAQAPHQMIWYAQQPWPGALVLKQMVLELISSLVIGLTIAAIAPPRAVPTAGFAKAMT